MNTKLLGPTKRPALGVVTPFDMELDYELWRFAPKGLDLLFTRTPFIDDEVSIDFTAKITAADPLFEAAKSVTSGRADVVTYACTSGSFAGGANHEKRIKEIFMRAGAKTALTTSGSIVAALQAKNITRVSIATPYTKELSHLFNDFLAEHGISTVTNNYLSAVKKIWEIPYEVTAELIRKADRPSSEAIVVSCTNLPTYDLIAPLEKELQKPIITANRATIWAALKHFTLPK